MLYLLALYFIPLSQIYVPIISYVEDSGYRQPTFISRLLTGLRLRPSRSLWWESTVGRMIKSKGQTYTKSCMDDLFVLGEF